MIDLLAVVDRLVGPVRPVADSRIDADRLENLKALCKLTEELIGRITSVAEDCGGHMASVKTAKDVATEFLLATAREIREGMEK